MDAEQSKAVIADLTEKLRIAREALRTVVNSTVHPEVAVRAVMVDLKPIRKALEDTK